jgi:hypothetical protein
MTSDGPSGNYCEKVVGSDMIGDTRCVRIRNRHCDRLWRVAMLGSLA